MFSTIAKKVAEFTKENPDKKIIKLGIGDVTRPIPKAVLKAMHEATDEFQKQKHLEDMDQNKDMNF